MIHVWSIHDLSWSINAIWYMMIYELAIFNTSIAIVIYQRFISIEIIAVLECNSKIFKTLQFRQSKSWSLRNKHYIESSIPAWGSNHLWAGQGIALLTWPSVEPQNPWICVQQNFGVLQFWFSQDHQPIGPTQLSWVGSASWL